MVHLCVLKHSHVDHTVAWNVQKINSSYARAGVPIGMTKLAHSNQFVTERTPCLIKSRPLAQYIVPFIDQFVSAASDI